MPDPARLVARRHPTLGRTVSGALTLDGADLAAIDEPTPFWVTGADTIRRRIDHLAAALAPLGIERARIHYAVKANDHLAVLRVIAGAGLGADVVSGGELLRALRAGIAPARIVFSGIGKTDAELRLALAQRVGQINVESVEELRALAALAAASGHVPDVALRVNPNIDAGTHDKISTGRLGDKFGIAAGSVEAAWAEGAACRSLRLRGLAVHIGSQVMDGAPFRAAAERIAGLVGSLRAAGHAVDAVDCGGGLGIGYGCEPDADPAALAAALGAVFAGSGLRLSVEPGRWIVGPAGVLVASVIRTKDALPHPFLIIDAAMNDLVRPALYDAWHGIVPLRATDAPLMAHDVAGPVCESSDVLARARQLPPLAAGDRVAILDAGAYGAVMSSTYNARPFAAAFLVDRGRVATIRPAMTAEQLWRDEIVPEQPGPEQPEPDEPGTGLA